VTEIRLTLLTVKGEHYLGDWEEASRGAATQATLGAVKTLTEGQAMTLVENGEVYLFPPSAIVWVKVDERESRPQRPERPTD
jgi:hypothetical protein